MKNRYQKLLNKLNHTNTLFKSDKLERKLSNLSKILNGEQLKIKYKSK